MLANAGLLIAGIPFKPLQPYTALLWIVGGTFVAISIASFIKDKVGRMKHKKAKETEKVWHAFIVGGTILVLGLFAFNLYAISQVKALQKQKADAAQQMPMMGQSTSRMSFSAFDEEKAREFMDIDGDGKCDSCGMEIDQCIASGMLQCSMDSNSKIGTLGSQHIHADWKIYLNGKPFDWTPYADLHEKQMMGDTSIQDTSAFMHIHPAQAPEKAGDILHMHAVGIPLRMLFVSLGMKLDNGCLVMKEEKHCNIKMYVNGKENTHYGDYVFNDLDKILITNGGNIEEQMQSITRFAEAH